MSDSCTCRSRCWCNDTSSRCSNCQSGNNETLWTCVRRHCKRKVEFRELCWYVLYSYTWILHKIDDEKSRGVSEKGESATGPITRFHWTSFDCTIEMEDNCRIFYAELNEMNCKRVRRKCHRHPVISPTCWLNIKSIWPWDRYIRWKKNWNQI